MHTQINVRARTHRVLQENREGWRKRKNAEIEGEGVLRDKAKRGSCVVCFLPWRFVPPTTALMLSS